MTAYAAAPKPPFRLGMLIYDTRYRSMTIQIVALVGFVILIAWLVKNTADNLATLGTGINFSFLGHPSGYDINQRLISYTSRSTNFRAAVVGFLNTMLVAVMGCILATVLGLIIGVLRLSKNWLVARLMTIYVEVFRNVPILLWIVFFMAILIDTLPTPRDFRGANATASMWLDQSVAITNRGFYVPKPLLSHGFGGAYASSLDFIAILLVLAAGIFAARVVKRRADQMQEISGVRPTTWYLRLGLIVFPVVVLLWASGFHLELPVLKGFNFAGGIYMRNSLISLWLALSLYTAAFIAEIVRGGIMAISEGQSEAAEALGLRSGQSMRLVVLPQALRVIIPPLISQYLDLTKNSSLAIAVGYMDLTGTLGGITLNQTGRSLECILLLMLSYLAISLAISMVMNWYNARVKLVER